MKNSIVHNYLIALERNYFHGKVHVISTNKSLFNFINVLVFILLDKIIERERQRPPKIFKLIILEDIVYERNIRGCITCCRGG